MRVGLNRNPPIRTCAGRQPSKAEMSPKPSPDHTLRAVNAELRARLEEAEETIRALRAERVNGLAVESNAGPQLFRLQNLDAEQSRLRIAMLAQVREAMIATDLEDRITFLNPAAEQLYRVHSESGPQIAAIFRHTLETGERNVSPRFSELRHDLGVEETF